MSSLGEPELPRLCPHCERQQISKNGRDRRGAPVYRCADGDRSFTALTGTPFSGHSFPPAVIGLAVRWYLRFRLSYADVVEWLAERHITAKSAHRSKTVKVFSWATPMGYLAFRLGPIPAGRIVITRRERLGVDA